MPNKLHIRKGDTVKVIAGDSKGEEGKVLMVSVEKNTALVEGINMVTKHSKPNSKNPQGGIIKMESPVNISNLMLLDSSGKPTRVGRRLDPKKETLVRYSKKTGEVIK